MKLLGVALLFSALAPAAAGLDGKWRAVFTGPAGERPKMISAIVLDLHSDGASLTGTVHASHWPGDAPVTNGRIEGDRIRFTFLGKFPWTAGSNGIVTTGYPKLEFTGAVSGEEMTLTLVWSSILTTGEEVPGRTYAMRATRVSE